MNAEAQAFWKRAKNAFRVPQSDLSLDSDASASRAYYAAFYAVSAHFAMQDRTFTRHTAVESAVHRDLVKPGLWPQELGAKFSRLSQLRARGDYGGEQHVDPEGAAEAVNAALDIIHTVAAASPTFFTLDEQ